VSPRDPVGSSSDEQLFVLDPHHGRVLSVRPDGRDMKVLLEGRNATPDGITVDAARGHLYLTNMGHDWNANDGFIERADLDGRHATIVVPPGGTFTPKQIVLDAAGEWLYWCDREGMRVMRARIDGSSIETLVQTGNGEEDRKDKRNWCVGIAVDTEGGHVYWTQKGPSKGGQGRIFRAGIDVPKGETPERRSDVELLFDGLPEPIDLELDLTNRHLYWTDRGAPPRGNTVNRASIDGRPTTYDVLVDGFREAIGLALDIEGRRMFVTDLAGSIHTATLDGEGKRAILETDGHFTGIAHIRSHAR